MNKKIKPEEIEKGDIVLIKTVAVEKRNGIVDLEFIIGKKTKIFMSRSGLGKIQIFPEDGPDDDKITLLKTAE